VSLTRRTTRGRAVRIGTVCLTVVAAVGLNAACSPADAESPKNVIVLIGDGMSFNQVDLTSLYEHGTSSFQVEVDPQSGDIGHVSGEPSQPFEQFDVQVSVATYPDEGSYDPAKAWSEFTYVDQGPRTRLRRPPRWPAG
jgi:alkaline phosphatase